MTIASSLGHMDWNLLRLFYCLYQSPSLSEAAKHLNLTQSSLSRHLAKLELSLGYRLFQRSRQGVSLLTEGQELLKLVTPVFHKFTQYQACQAQPNDTLQGTLKLLIAAHLPISWLMHDTANFLHNHPQLSLNLSQQMNITSRFTQQADCTIQLFDDRCDDDLIQQPLCTLLYDLYTSRDYLNQRGDFDQFTELQNHPKLIVKAFGSDYPFGWPENVSCDGQAAPVHIFSTAQDVLTAVRQGFGIAALPRQQAASYPDLVAVPFYLNNPIIKLCYVYPRYYQDLRRVTLYGDFLEQTLKNYTGFSKEYFVPVDELIPEIG